MSVSPALAGQAPLYKLSCQHPWQSIPSPIEGIVRLSVAKIVAYFSSPVARFFRGRKFFCRCAIGGPPASQSRSSALSWHRPGCLGCPGCPGQGTGPAKRPGAYLGHRQVAIHFQPLPMDGPPARHFIFRRADQDRQDSQDPQEGGRVGLRTGQALSWESWESCWSWPRRWSREAARCLPGHRPAAKSAAFPAPPLPLTGRSR